MIIATPHIPDTIVVPSEYDTMDTGRYFNPRLRIVTQAALRRDARPADALDQIFGYFQP